MRNSDGQKPQGGVVHRSGRTNGFFPSSIRTISSYLKIVSSGASTVARSAVSVASSMIDNDEYCSNDQVLWAGFDKLDCGGGTSRQVLLLGYRSGFQVWDVEGAENVCDLVSRQDGPVSFMQILPKPVGTKSKGGNLADCHPLLVVCVDVSSSGGGNVQDGLAADGNGNVTSYHDTVNGIFLPNAVQFYSLKSQSYVHVLKFRSVVYSIRCNSRVVAVCLAAQIQCFDARTLEREYTIVTNHIVTGGPGSGGLGYGPLALGSRWLAYSGSPVVVSNSGRVGPQQLIPSVNFSGYSSNGNVVAYYAKESSKQFAAGIVTLGDMGYKKLSRYYSELLPDSNNSVQSGQSWKGNRTVNGHLQDIETVGMVIVRDIVNKLVIAQFRAHKSPISALCFDPTGTLLVTASVQGHNINVFKIMPGPSGSSLPSDAGASYVHLYRLQRGFTNAIIQDISFSDDSNWIMISSSRGTSHLFVLDPLGAVNLPCGDANFSAKNNGVGVTTKSAVRWLPNSSLQMPNQQNIAAPGPPVTLSVVSRIRNGSNGWRGTVSGAAAAATGRLSSLSGAIATTFHNCKRNDLYVDGISLNSKYHLLVFSPSGCMTQYALRLSTGMDPTTVFYAGNIAYETSPVCDARLLVEAIQKWSICQKHNRRERGDNVDIYGENGISDSNKIYPEGIEENIVFPDASDRVIGANTSPEEKHHLYISEAELQMHHIRKPLWAKSEIYFQSMKIEGVQMDEENDLGGELEIERILTHIIEARPKVLIPVFDHLQTPKLQQGSIRALDGNGNSNGQMLHQRSGLSDYSQHMSRSSSGSLDSMAENGSTVAELLFDADEIGWCDPRGVIESKLSVNNNYSPKMKTHLEIVNNTDCKIGGSTQVCK